MPRTTPQVPPASCNFNVFNTVVTVLIFLYIITVLFVFMQINVFIWGVYQGCGVFNTCIAINIFRGDKVEVYNFGMDNAARVPWLNGFNPTYSENRGKEKLPFLILVFATMFITLCKFYAKK